MAGHDGMTIRERIRRTSILNSTLYVSRSSSCSLVVRSTSTLSHPVGKVTASFGRSVLHGIVYSHDRPRSMSSQEGCSIELAAHSPHPRYLTSHSDVLSQ
jgi:hypothetical protein